MRAHRLLDRMHHYSARHARPSAHRALSIDNHGRKVRMSNQPLVIDDQVKSVIGTRGQVRTAIDVASTSEMRRFAHAVFDDNRIYFDAQAARASRFGTRVGPAPFILTN